VVPLFRTARYLDDLLGSFDEQLPGPYDLEFVFVDDGSDDDSGLIAERWLDRSDVAGQVIRQDNGGVSNARNTGIAAATGDWITFPDSDDILGASYFAAAAEALRGTGPDVQLLSANVWRYDDATGRRHDVHPLRQNFRAQRTTVDLQQEPVFIQTRAASAFFRMSLIREHDIRFIDGLTVAEDAIFAATYLLHAPTALIAPLKEAVYYYRQRSDASAATDTYKSNRDFYFGRFDRGYVPLIELARSMGEVPRWMEYLILYDLNWYFPRELDKNKKATHLTEAEQSEVIGLLQQVLEKISASAIVNYRLTWMSPEVRALVLTLSGRDLPDAGTVRMTKNLPGSFEICYLYQGDLPEEVLASNGRAITPLAAKTRKLDYFGQELLHERILRLPEVSGVSVTIDGRQRPLLYGPYYLGSSEATAARARIKPSAARKSVPLWRQIAARGAAEVMCFTSVRINAAPGATRKGTQLRGKRYREGIRNLARAPHFANKFTDAWLIMDRIDSCRDNGEYLYEYLRAQRPDINAWFVVKKDCPEWKRLSDLGFRLIAYRSIEHKAALQSAALVASSQLDVEIVQPVPRNFYPGGRRPWRFVYLQHGVLQHDLAHWFNNKDIDLLTTASVDEHESIVADNSSYKLTTDSVAMTGFPRHDAIVKAAEQHPYDKRSVVLVAPTWRDNMFLAKPRFGAKRKLRDPFLETAYGRNWMGLLRHPELKRLADEQNAEIIYLPHPAFRGNTPGVTFPDYVTVIESTPDIHELMARARVTVTDYSSIFFDAALAKSRIVHFQFDQDTYFDGSSHTYLPGYWSYEKHGFGPIASSLDDAVRMTTDAFESDWPAHYQDRISRILPLADGKSADRITQLIESKFLS
jgi:glycosyltransferase involved in cell wall biosynthesis